MDNNQNTNMENTEKKETIFGKAKGFIKNHKKAFGIGLLALVGAGAAAVTASKKSKNEDDDLSDVSWKDLENDEEANSESTGTDEE